MSSSKAVQGLGAWTSRCAAGPLRGARGGARAAALAAMGLLCVAEAHAAPEPPRAALRLEVVRGPGAEGCPDEAFLRAEVARRLGADPFQDDAPRGLTVHIAREGPEVTASLALRDREGETQWADGFGTRSGCEELMSGVALAIVAQLLGAPEPAGSPSESLPPSDATPPPGTTPPEPAVPPSPQARRTAPDSRQVAELSEPPPRPQSSPAVPERLRLEAGLGATLGLGIIPGVATGMTLSLGVRRSDWSIAVEGRGLVSLAQEVEGLLMGTTGFTAATLACYRGGPLFGCGLATLGTVRFSPRDPWTMSLRSDSVFGLGARLGTEWPFSRRWSVQGYGEATWMVNEGAFTRVTHDSTTPAPLRWTSSPLGAAFGLGVTAIY
ncbi:hypothetical protein SOCE26_038430 [Sorangium cellulosum]|uniref:Secreted protein n=1 Tax=Sorangium cellulosum TaxID=56 RepID=A0A2L0ET18_SORCE|nr:hypothetical protein [Sorangium cellulosum]AUX42412.1 hypothetical protein SOCE26_038430 [Sorangium cellulosum]